MLPILSRYGIGLIELHTLIRDTLITYRGSNDIIKTL